MRHISKRALARWLRRLPWETRRRFIERSDPARVFSLHSLASDWEGLFSEPQRVAVVSGSKEDPELMLVPDIASVELLEFEANPDFYDLTKDWSAPEYRGLHQKFDLVLCEQVLEHLPTPEQAVKNLSLLVKKGGYLHLSVPAINNSHGEPHYYFAGFHTRYLEFACSSAGLTPVSHGSWGSDKAARMYSTCDWAPLSSSGPLSYFLFGLATNWNKPKQLVKLVLARIENFLRYPFLGLVSTPRPHNQVISWATAQKK